MTFLLERPTKVDVVDEIIRTFVDSPPAWAEARSAGDLLEVNELERHVVWTIRRHRVERALERMASQEALRNLEPLSPSRRTVRRMHSLLEPERVITPHLANVIVQVAIFGELEHS